MARLCHDGTDTAMGRTAHLAVLPVLSSAAQASEDSRGLPTVEPVRVGAAGEGELASGLPEVRKPEEREPEVEADEGGARVAAGERPEARERRRRIALLETRERRSDPSLEVFCFERECSVLFTLLRVGRC
ncbi:MAG: hypothetical protein M3304_10900 [Actinomycetota bacterium]|nr:hypothetical protein [Actinomycetota bacterium]